MCTSRRFRAGGSGIAARREFELDVCVGGDRLLPGGYVVDFNVLSTVADEVVGSLSDRELVERFGIEPSLEILTDAIWWRVRERLFAYLGSFAGSLLVRMREGNAWVERF